MKKLGFTLIELLIVVAIIAILAAIAVPNFLEAQTRSKVSRCKADMRSTLTALEAYAVVNVGYPPMGDLGTQVNVSNMGFHARVPNYLTTPVAFMTSITYDPFVLQQSTWYDDKYPIETQVGKRYAYYHTKLLVELWGDAWGGLYNWVGAHLIYGYGPDQNWTNSPDNSPGGDTLVPYDPTNGTISYGNIIRCQKMTDGIPPHPVNGDYYF